MDRPFRILDERDDLIVVEKPAGLLTHASKPAHTRTLRDLLCELLSYECMVGGQVSIVTRLDRETSGLVLVAKTREAARACGRAMMRGEIGKRYLAIVHGWPTLDAFEIDAPILRRGEVGHSPVYLERIVHPAGVPAHTRVRVLERFERGGCRFAWVEAEPLAGRTHQIRVHFAHVGHPVVGDKLYGPTGCGAYLRFIQTGWTDALARQLLLPRHALHAARLEMHWDGQLRVWESPVPEDLRAFWDRQVIRLVRRPD